MNNIDFSQALFDELDMLLPSPKKEVQPIEYTPPVVVAEAVAPLHLINCHKLADALIAEITKDKAYRVLDAELMRDAGGMLDVNKELVVGKQHISLAQAIWKSIRSQNECHTLSKEVHIALGIAVRRLGLGGINFDVSRQVRYQDLASACEKQLQLVRQTLGNMPEDRDAWMFIQKLILSYELDIPLTTIQDDAVEPVWQMNQPQAEYTTYPFEYLRKVLESLPKPEELFKTGHPFGAVVAVYELLVQDLTRIHDAELIAHIEKMAPRHRLSLIKTVIATLGCDLPVGKIQQLIAEDRKAIIQPKQTPVAVVAKELPKAVIDSAAEEKAYQQLKTHIATHLPKLKAKIEEGHASQGAVFLDKDDQDALIGALSNVSEAALLTFIDGHNIVFTDDAKEAWDPDDKIHLMLHLATCVPLQERGRFLQGKPYAADRPKKLSVVDPSTESADNSWFTKDLKKARSKLTQEHLIEMHRISKALAEGRRHAPSDALTKAIKNLKVEAPIRLLIEDLVHNFALPNGYLTSSDYIVGRLSMRLKVPQKAIPNSCKSLVSFIWNAVEKHDDTTSISGREDIKELRSKFIHIAQDQFSNPRKIFDRPDALLQSLTKSIKEAKTYLIDEKTIETAVKDILSYFKITKRDIEGHKDEQLKTWFTEVEPKILEEEQSKPVGCQLLSHDEVAAFSKALVEWKIAQAHTFKPGASGKIIEAVPCLFFQSIAYSEHKRLFPWCALMSERGLEGIVRSSPKEVEAQPLTALLKEATGQESDFALCKTKGIALDPAELLQLMRQASLQLRNGKKIVMIAQFLKPAAGIGLPGGQNNIAANNSQGQESLIRHPGLLVISDEVQEKQRSTPHAQKITPEQETRSVKLPEWAEELYDDGSYLCEAANWLIQLFAEDALKQMGKRQLEDVQARELLPLLTRYDQIQVPTDLSGPFHLELHDYQKRSVLRSKRLHEEGVNGLICLDTGLGKTRVASELLFQKLLDNPKSVCLVIAPNAVKPQWKYEFERTVLLASLKLLLPHYKQKECFELFASILVHHSEYIFELFPVVTKNNLATIKQNLANNLPILADKLPQHRVSEVRQQIDAITTLASLKERIKEYATTELHLKMTLEALFPLLSEHPMAHPVAPEFLQKLALFHKAFPEHFVHVIQKPSELAEAWRNKKPGILVAAESQLSALCRQPKEAEKLQNFCPSFIVIDEAHQLLTQKHDGKEQVMASLMRAWHKNDKPAVVALTATPIVNEMADLIQLLSLINPGTIGANIVSRFEIALELLKRELQSARQTFNELHDKVQLDPTFTIASSQSIKRALFNLLWLKERMLTPLIDKVSREDDEVQALGKDNLPTVRTIKKIVEPQGRQMELVASVVKKFKHSFLEKTDQIERCLIHPDFFAEEDIDTVINKFDAMSNLEKEQFLLQSATLKAAFCDEASELTGAFARKQKALVYVKHQKTAEFVKRIAKWKYSLDDKSVFVVHSSVAKRDQIIETFKQITNKAALLILLPKSGGVGLNFTNVELNYMMTAEWTHEKDKQAKARILRGVGERTIVSLQHAIPERKHILNVAKKKRHFSDLLLPSKESSLEFTLKALLKTVEAMVSSQEKQVVVSDAWRAFFKEQLTKICAEFRASANALECEYLEKQAKTLTDKPLCGYYVSPSQKILLHYRLIPMPQSQERPPYLRALQIGLHQCVKGNRETYNAFLEQTGTPQVLAQWVRANFQVEGLKTQAANPQAYINAIIQAGGAVNTYEWANGTWGSHLKRTNTQGKRKDDSKVVEILKDGQDYYLLTQDVGNNKPLKFSAE